MELNKNMKILVIDDMKAMRKILQKMLNEMGLENINEAGDGNVGWEMIDTALKESQPYDLVIADWNMPNMSGFELLKKMKEVDTTRKIPFLMVTCEASNKKVLAAVNAGVSNYIAKPLTLESLQEKLHKIFE